MLNRCDLKFAFKAGKSVRGSDTGRLFLIFGPATVNAQFLAVELSVLLLFCLSQVIG